MNKETLKQVYSNRYKKVSDNQCFIYSIYNCYNLNLILSPVYSNFQRHINWDKVYDKYLSTGHIIGMSAESKVKIPSQKHDVDDDLEELSDLEAASNRGTYDDDGSSGSACESEEDNDDEEDSDYDYKEDLKMRKSPVCILLL